MKTKIFLVLLLAFALFSCQKEKNDPATTQDVSFSAIQVDPDAGLKNTEDWPCKTDVPTHAWIVINGVNYYPQLFTLGNGKLYTQAIKLPIGPYAITSFVLYKEGNGVADYQVAPVGDIIVFGAPLTGSPYAVYVTDPLDKTFSVEAFKKAEIPIEVLCFEDAHYTGFGFFWFNITEIVIRKQCFFGDLCIKDIADYNISGSHYLLQSTGVQIDMPAIIELRVQTKVGTTGTWGNVPYTPFTNDNPAANYGVGAPVCIEYADNLSQIDSIKVDLYILVRVGPGFGFVWFKQWKFRDAEMLVPPPAPAPPPNSDGVVDFVLGACNLSYTDVQLAPYMNLPATCGLQTQLPIPGLIPTQGLGSTVGYFDVTLSGIGAGYDIGDLSYGINCFNRGVVIAVPGFYTMDVTSSLYPENMIGPCKTLNWGAANWLINHLGMFPGYRWYDVQQVFWKIELAAWDMSANAGVPAATPILAMNMYNAAIAGGVGYVPLPGGWAGVAFENMTPPVTQCIFLRVDP